MAVHVSAEPTALVTSIDDDKLIDLNVTDDFDSPAKLELEDSIQSNISDSGTEDDDSVYRFDKKSASYGSARRFFNKSTAKTWKGTNRKSIGEDSKEYFILQFDDDDKDLSNAEKVPAKKGKSLKESIENLLFEHGIDFTTHSVFVESSKTPLPLAFDTFPLGGNVLYVKENQSMQVDERIITLMKSAEDDKRVQNQRAKQNIIPSLFNDAVGVSTTNKNASVARKSGVTSGLKDENISLSEVLNNYKFNHLDTESNTDSYENYLNDTYLEESWTDVITDDEGMTSKDKIQQETIWELLITERNYLRKIRVIIMVFKNCLVTIQKENFLEDIDIDKLFANIKEVYDTNHKFLENHLRHVTEEVRATKKPIKPSQLTESFASFEELFQPYIRYCLEEGSCVKYLKQLKRENEMFQEYLAWCENHRLCMRLKLADLLVKPMQRVTKYGLLLKAILSKTIEEDEKNALQIMISEVERFVTKINTTLRLRNEYQKLEKVLESLDTYNPIEAANEEMEKLLESYYSNFNLHGNIPGLHEEEQRCILLDGAMKMIEKQGRIDVHAFLFTDVLILAKAKKGTDKFRVIRQPFRLNKVMLHQSKDMGAFNVVYLNEYRDVVTAFTLQCAGNEQIKWFNAIQKAKKRYEDARAARGSTLAFFDDDLPSSSAFAASFYSSTSPMPDRRSIVSDDNRSLDPPSISKEDIRCRSTEAVSQAHHKPEDVTSVSHVKRSFSDPKTGTNYSGRERSSSKQKGRPRPKSLVNISEHDNIATWVLTNQNRNQSGSLTSDISDDSQRSSGIGDSFRSIHSDGGIVIPFANSPILSKVGQLKARFENNGCNSPNTDGSDSSVSTPSILGFPETSPALPECRRVSPPDYMDNHVMMKGDDEQSTNNLNTVLASIAASDKDTLNDSSESLRTLNDRSSTLRSSNRSCEHANFLKPFPLKLTYVSTETQTELSLSMCCSHSSLNPQSEQSEQLKDDLETKSHCKCIDLGNVNAEVTSENLASADVADGLPNSSEKSTENLKESHILKHSSNICDFQTLGAVTMPENAVGMDAPVKSTDLDKSERSADLNLKSVDHPENVISDIHWSLSGIAVCQNSMFTNDKSESLLKSEFAKVPSISISTQVDEKTITQELTPENNIASVYTSQSTMTEELKEFNDVATQYEVLNNVMIDTTTQCGELILLAAKDDETCAKKTIRTPVKTRTETTNVSNIRISNQRKTYQKSLSDDGCGSKSTIPFTNMKSDRPHSALTYRRHFPLKHSTSEANVGVTLNQSISPIRSPNWKQNSLPNSPENRHNKTSTPIEFPGMYALQTLSESLESSIQKRLQTSLTVNESDVNSGINSDIKLVSPEKKSGNDIIIRRSNSNSSTTSLRKLAIMNNSPLPARKELPGVDPEEAGETDTFNEDLASCGPTSQSSPKLRNRKKVEAACNEQEEGNKRFTWHDFDSLAALNRIEETKYGHSLPCSRSATLPLDRTLSKSSEILDSKRSFKKRSIIKRFTDVLNRSDESRSSLDQSNITKESTDDKSSKKIQKKEKKRLKREKRDKDREEKKRGVVGKGRSASVSSGNSRFSFTPLSSTNIFGSQ